MSKKPRKSRHRVPSAAFVATGEPISARYLTEVEYATNRLERRYQRAVKAREAALRRLETAIRKNAKSSYLAELRRQVEIREYELDEIVKLMQPGNRTKVPWRPVPITP